MNKNKSTVQYMYFLVFVSLIWDKTNFKKMLLWVYSRGSGFLLALF